MLGNKPQRVRCVLPALVVLLRSWQLENVAGSLAQRASLLTARQRHWLIKTQFPGHNATPQTPTAQDKQYFAKIETHFADSAAADALARREVQLRDRPHLG